MVIFMDLILTNTSNGTRFPEYFEQLKINNLKGSFASTLYLAESLKKWPTNKFTNNSAEVPRDLQLAYKKNLQSLTLG